MTSFESAEKSVRLPDHNGARAVSKMHAEVEDSRLSEMTLASSHGRRHAGTHHGSRSGRGGDSPYDTSKWEKPYDTSKWENPYDTSKWENPYDTSKW
jgi:hypothetical protein